MENNKNIILIALAVFSIVILLAQNNIDKVFAFTLITKQWNTGSKVEDSMFYDSERGKVLICSTDLSTIPDTREIHIFDAETLVSTSNTTSAIDDNEDCETQHENSLVCLLSTDSCYKIGLHAGGGAGGGANPAGIMITKYSLVSGTTTSYTNTTWTSSAMGKIVAIVGSLAYFSNSAGAMPAGVWAFNIITAFDGITTNDDFTLSRLHAIALPSGFGNGCYDSSSNVISVVQGNTVGKIDVSTGQFTDLGNNLGAVVSETVCFDNFAWYVSSVGGWVKKVNPSTGATSATITLASSTTVMKHGNLILIGAGSTVYSYDSTTLTQTGTFVGFTGSAVKILRKNATAFYFMGSTERIHLYNGLPDDGSEEAPPEEVDNTCVENPETVFCRLGGTNDNSTSGVGSLIGAGIINLGCNIAFVDCTTDSNPATNGLGILIFIASIFVIVGMFYWATGRDAFHMPLFIWILIIIALSAFFTIIGIIDPVFLIISIIAIVALAAPKVLSALRGNTFGGGSTE